MRTFKMLGLAAVAALSLVAFIGTSAASAANTTLCNTASNPCPAANQYASGTTLNAALQTGTNAVLTTSGGLFNPTVTCTASTVRVVTSAQTGNPLPGSVTALTFTGCTSANPTGTCTVTVNNLPYTGNINYTAPGNGSMTVNSPNVTVACSGLPTCSYTAASATGTVTGGNPATVAFTSVPLSVAGGFGCPTGASWTATYRLVASGSPASPTAVWVEQP
jgi:hypothetical protein